MVKRIKLGNFSGGLHLKKVSWGKGFLRLVVLAAFITALAPAPVFAQGAWYDPGWKYRQEITIDHNMVGTMSAITSDADSGQDVIFVQDTSRFSADDFVVIMDDSSSETIQIDTINDAQNKLTMWDDLSNSYTTAAHAFVKNDSAQGDDLSNFPVLVQITSQSNAIFGQAQADGDDILFTASNGITKLSHEIDYYSDSGTKELDAWVKVPTVSTSADTTLYMYYGNASCSSQENSEDVWSEDYVMVQHLQESSPTGTYNATNVAYDDHLDSTSNHNDGEVFADNSVCSENITVPKAALPQIVTLTHGGLVNAYLPVVVCRIVGTTYNYYYEGTDWTLDYDTGELTALAGGNMTKNTAYWFDYTYEDTNVGANMTAPGKIGLADSFDGLDDFIDCKDVNIGNITEAITVEAWVNLGWRAGIGMEVDNPDYGIVSSSAWELCVWNENAGDPPDPIEFYNSAWFSISEIQYGDCWAYNIIIPTDTWAHVAITFNGTDIYSYVNRDFDATAAASGSIDSVPGEPTLIAMSTDLCEAVKGRIDEVRISDVAREAGWFSTSYSNQLSPDLFCSLAAEELGGWESYQASARSTVWGTSSNHYDSSYHIAYMRGEGFTASHNYKIGYYDSSGAQASSTESASSNATGVLDGAYDLNTDSGAAVGTWHAVVLDTTGSIPDTYDGAVASGDYVAEDDFIVDASAIPEFPTIMAGIGVAGLCFGIYYWMRKRKQRQVAAA